MKKSTRWAWGVAAVAFAGVTMVLLFVLSLTGDAGSFVERHIAWLFWLNVAVALFLLVVIARPRCARRCAGARASSPPCC